MKFLVLSSLALSFLFQSNLFAQKPELLLLNKYTKENNVTNWYMSEKLDGVRAYWNGVDLISRSGKSFAVPYFFIKDFPNSELDGELWSKRGEFSKIASIVNKKTPHEGWSKLDFYVFEVPHHEGNLTTRLSSVNESKYIKVVKQKKIEHKKDLYKFLKTVESKGGEGIVVRNGTLSYYTGRTNDALKVKSYLDEECQVVSYKEGTGKYLNQLGSLLCKMNSGKIIKIGTGFSDEERRNPPKIGTLITFKYYGLTSKGNPRFPVFMRKRLYDEL